MSGIRHVSFRRLGSSEMHLRYLEEDRDLAPFLGSRPRSAKDLVQRAPLDARRVLAVADLGRTLLAYAERHGAPDAALQSARAMADGVPTVAVVTGQQPGLLGGPLYTLHKAATAVRLARELSAALPDGPRVVPLFWNHSDDHDWDEVNRAFFVNAQQEVQRVRLDVGRTGEAIRYVKVGHLLPGLIDEVADTLLPDTEFRDWALRLWRPADPDEGLAAGLTRALFALFGDDGLLVLEPRELPAPAFGVLEKWWKLAPEVRSSVRSSSEHLNDIGLEATIDPGATLLFQLSGKRRTPMSDDEPLPRDLTDMSPGVLLRPLWQDACLPTVGFVVGPGELAYMSLIGPLYRLLGVPRPCLIPRASMTLMEPSLDKLLVKFGWDLPDLADGAEALTARRLARDQSSELDQRLRELADDFERRCTALLERARSRRHDGEERVLAGVDRLRGKTVDDLVKLADRLSNSRADAQGTGARQIRRLCSWLRPRGRLQERVLGPLPALVSHGPRLGRILVDAADPFGVEHAVVVP